MSLVVALAVLASLGLVATDLALGTGREDAETAASPSASASPQPPSPTAPLTAQPADQPADQPSARPTPALTPAQRAYDRMTPEQRVGQLFMIGVTSTDPTRQQLRLLRESEGGNVFLRGKSDLGVRATARITDQLVETTTSAGVSPLISADQEGGGAQSLEGPGFEPMPSGLTQGSWEPARLRGEARGWAEDLLEAGVNLDLAPVADVVPADVGSANAPIGAFSRQYGDRPGPVGRSVRAFSAGMSGAGVATTLKHFPGIGRASGNTDSDPSVTDPTTADDPFVSSFAPAIRAGAPVVMVSSARYPGIDGERACFSSAVMRDLLREDLGFDGVVVSDSFGSASVYMVPPGRRAVRFFEAGGTLLLDTNWLDLAPMTTAVLARSRTDADFAAVVRDDVMRVLRLKATLGLLGEGTGSGTG